MMVENVFTPQSLVVHDCHSTNNTEDCPACKTERDGPVVVTIRIGGKLDLSELRDALEYGLDRYWSGSPDVLKWIEEQ